MMNSPSRYSVEQLLQARQDGVPDYVVVPMLQKAMAEKQAVQQQAALQQGAQPQAPVAQQILSAANNSVMQDHMARKTAEEPRGIDSLPSGIDEKDYAGGGIIAFSKGAEVPEVSDYGDEDEGIALPQVKGNNYFNSRDLHGGKDWASFDTPESSFRQFAHQMALYGNRGWNTPAKIFNKYSPNNENDTSKIISNVHDWTGYAPDEELDLTDPDVVSNLAHATLRNERSLNIPPSEIKKLMNKGRAKVGEKPLEGRGIQDLVNSRPEYVEPDLSGFDKLAKSPEETDVKARMAEGRDIYGTNPDFERRAKEYDTREQDIKSDKDKAVWEALMQAGIGMMGGTSPNFLANMAKGLEEGAKGYGQSKRDIREREANLREARDALGDAKYAEKMAIANYGVHSAEAAKAANEKLKFAKVEAQLKGSEEKNRFNKDIYESDARSAAYGETARHNKEMERLGGERIDTAQSGKGRLTTNQALGSYDKAINQLNREIKDLTEGKGTETMTDDQIQSAINSKQQDRAKYQAIQNQIRANPSITITADMLPIISGEPVAPVEAAPVDNRSMMDKIFGTTPQPKTPAPNPELDSLLKKYSR